MNRSIRQAVASLRKARSAASWVTCLAHVTYALRQLDPRKAQSAFRKELGAAHKAKVEGKIQKRRTSTKEIREAVLARAEAWCEQCCRPFDGRGGPEMDHWLSGGGRRRQQQAVENCWALCTVCHIQRTRNRPSGDWWNARFAVHCAKYQYPFHPHVEHAAVPRRSANV